MARLTGDVVAVPCQAWCQRVVTIARDDLRGRVERDERVVCPACIAQAARNAQRVARLTRLTKQEMILLAAARLDLRYPDAFPLAALVVEAWQAHPQAFGLPGFEADYPDSNRVTMDVVKIEKFDKFLERTAPRQYRITEAGREHARRVAGARKAVAS